MKKSKGLLLLTCIISLIVIGFSTAGAQEIGLAWVGKSGMANRVTSGFDEVIKQIAPDMKIEYQKELAGLDDLAALAAKWHTEKNGMVILRSNGAEWLGKNLPTIPTFIGGCNSPVLLGAVKNLDAPEGNITGVTYFLPYETQFDIFKAIIPDMKSVLLLVQSGHPGSEVDKDGTKAICEKLGIDYQVEEVTTKEEAIAKVGEYSGKVSAIIMGIQAILMDNTAEIVPAAGSTPVLAYSNEPVQKGALGGFAADDVKLGGMLAESVVDVLVNGKAIKDVPVKMDPNPKFYINAKSAEALGIDIPYHILELATVVE
jgi:putative tryptophan/tyrosine transport system substrate-binding protein